MVRIRSIFFSRGTINPEPNLKHETNTNANPDVKIFAFGLRDVEFFESILLLRSKRG